MELDRAKIQKPLGKTLDGQVGQNCLAIRKLWDEAYEVPYSALPMELPDDAGDAEMNRFLQPLG